MQAERIPVRNVPADDLPEVLEMLLDRLGLQLWQRSTPDYTAYELRPSGVPVVLPAASVRVCTVTDTECPRQCGSDPCRLEQSCAERAANPKPRGAPGVDLPDGEQP